jgi:hypothetical protein
VQPRLDLFQVHHVCSLARMAVVAKKVQEQQDLLSDEKSQARFTGEVKVSIELAKFGILDRIKGKFYHGKRIREAKATEDVLEVFVQVFPQGTGEIDSMGFVVVRIIARTQASLDKSMSMLKFTEQTVYIPNDYTTRVIGKDGNLIQDLIDKCGILRVAVMKKELIPAECLKNNITPFILIGLESKLESAKALIDYQISYLQQEENLEAKYKNLQVEIKKVRGHFLNTDGETDRQTDSDSGYKTNLTVKLPTSWAVEESPPPEDLIEEEKAIVVKPVQNKRNNRPTSAKNNRNRRANNQTTDGEFTDTDAYATDAGQQSDARPTGGVPSFAQLLNPNAGKSPRNEKPPAQKAAGDSKKATVDLNNNNIVGNGDSKPQAKKAPVKKAGDGDKPLPQRQNKRGNRNNRNKNQTPVAAN